MIVEYVLAFVVEVIVVVLDALPAWDTPLWMQEGGELDSALTTIGSAADGMANWLPFGAVVQVLPAALAALGGIAVARGAIRVVNLIRGSGG